MGLDERDIWCYRIKILFARHRNVPPEAVNLLNFSRAGASVDYIVRVLVSQLTCFTPDLVLACPGSRNRSEYWFKRDEANQEMTININPHLRRVMQGQQSALRTAKMGSFSQHELEQIFRAVSGYYTYYTDEVGLINQIRNYLLLQSFCRRRVVPLCIWAPNRFSFVPDQEKGLPDHARELMKGLDFDRILDVDLSGHTDLAADKIHQGPESNRVAVGK